MVAIQFTNSTQTQARRKVTDCASADEFTHCSAKFLASVRKSTPTDHAYTEKGICAAIPDEYGYASVRQINHIIQWIIKKICVSTKLERWSETYNKWLLK